MKKFLLIVGFAFLAIQCGNQVVQPEVSNNKFLQQS